VNFLTIPKHICEYHKHNHKSNRKKIKREEYMCVISPDINISPNKISHKDKRSKSPIK
jgi:hypothetical protein